MSISVQNCPVLLVADAHVRPGTHGEEEFLEMLAWISSTAYDVAFLGDVLELWIGVPSYETALSRKFLSWCRQEKGRRRVFFVEGNHELFVVRHHSECFTASSTDELEMDGLLIAHGDTCQNLLGHRFFRWFSKSGLAHFLLRWLPIAPWIVRCLKRNFERKARKRRECHYPEKDVAEWAVKTFQAHPAAKSLFLGHFHCHQEDRLPDGHAITVLPAWKDDFQIGLFSAEKPPVVSIQNWRAF